MENSLSSCINKAVASKGTTNSPEESGWTAYFEDFSSYEGHSSSNSSLHTSSVVSDAASSAAWKNSNSNQKIPKRLSFKKTRTKIISFDDSLEDTASSPVSSPKVGDLEPGDMNPRKAHDHHIISSLSKADTIDHYNPELQADERREIMNFGGKNNHDYTELRKRGLCLVPLSKEYYFVCEKSETDDETFSRIIELLLALIMECPPLTLRVQRSSFPSLID